ncbi:MAG TPA: hypothetical protein VMU40_08900 [Steroidobacteraceae bacterium]|nr:hypothetical protein [Steroidobacteraceae bacterium]
MRTPRLLRQLRLALVLVAAGVFAGGVGLAHAQGHGGGGHGGGAHYGGGGHFGGGFGGGHFGGYGGHYGYRGGPGGWHGGYYGGWGRGYWGGGWGWWGPGWWGVGVYAAWLPWYYNLYWWDGYPYYYYGNSYYVWDGDAGEYQQVNPPQGFHPDTSAPSAEQAPMNSELFAYPRAGQSPAQQARDKDECSRWASGQTGAQASPGASGARGGPAGAPPPGSTAAAAPPNALMQHDAYLRAEAACLEGRNYTVR